jgi:hypothetical protein
MTTIWDSYVSRLFNPLGHAQIVFHDLDEGGSHV